MLFNQLNLFSLLDAMDVEVSREDREALSSLWQPQLCRLSGLGLRLSFLLPSTIFYVKTFPGLLLAPSDCATHWISSNYIYIFNYKIEIIHK